MTIRCSPPRHATSDTIRLVVLDYQSEVFAVFRNSKQYRKLKRLGYLGDVKALETPYSDANGWHPHYHTLIIFNRKLTDDERLFVRKN